MTETSQDTAPKPSAFRTFFNRRMLVMLGLGFSSGLPFMLVFDTLSTWLRDSGLSLEVIGFFSLATLSYSFKFLWAPLIDRTTIPGLTKLVGHRRSWMLVCQAGVIFGLWLISGSDPVRNLPLMAAFAVAVGFISATQDIVIDAWRIEVSEEHELGATAAANAWGYRVSMVISGAVPLLLADAYNWNVAYAAMAAMMAIGVASVIFAPREKKHALRPIHAEDVEAQPAREWSEWIGRLLVILVGALFIGSGLTGDAALLAGILTALGQGGAGEQLAETWKAQPWAVVIQIASVLFGGFLVFLSTRPLPGKRTRPGVYLDAAMGDPLRDFFHRYQGSAGLILALICLYRLSDFVLNIMNPFYRDLGFSLTEIAEVRKVFGVVCAMVGVGIGGWMVVKLGMMRALVIGAFAVLLSNLIFAWLATQGHSLPALFIAIGIDNTLGGISGTCLIAYMSSLTASGFTATQYALFTSLYALPGKLVASQSGRIVEASARSAEGDGPLSALKGLFGSMTPESLVSGAQKANVTPAALGAGYFTFFLYSSLIGVVAVVLTFMVARRQPPKPSEP